MAEARADLTNDMIIKHNFEVFLPYIVLTVDTKSVLAFLTCFTKEERKLIFATYLRNPVESTTAALNIIRGKNDTGLFTEFKDAMESAGYPKIVKMLSGEPVNDDEHQQKLIDLFTSQLVKRIDPIELLPHLLKSGVLIHEDSEEVRAECMNHGSQHGCWILLSHLPQRMEDWFELFMKALVECKKDDVAKMLDPDLFEKLKAQADFRLQNPSPTSSIGSDMEEPWQERGPFLYTRKFLLDCRMSPLAKTAPACLKDIPEIWVRQPTDTNIERDLILYTRKSLLDCQMSPLAKTAPPTDTNIGEETIVKQACFSHANLPEEDERGNMPVMEKSHETMDTTENLVQEATCRVLNMASNGNKAYNVPADTGKISNLEDDLDTTTDADVIPEGSVNEADLLPQLREYQKELAREGAEGENAIVLAPTNTGKTWVACYIIQEHFRQCARLRKNGKVVFIVETEALAVQQGNLCTSTLPSHRTKVITGTMQRDKQQYLKDFVDRRDILIVTAMVLVNCLREREIENLTKFSLLVFDECHHANFNHPYNMVLSQYRRLKLQDDLDLSTLPQIVGLSASLGVGNANSTDHAKIHMKQIMANMDAKYLSTVRSPDCLENMKIFVNPPTEEIVTVPARQVDIFGTKVENIMENIDGIIAGHRSIQELTGKDREKIGAFRVPNCKGSEQFIQWISNFKEQMVKVNSIVARELLAACRLHLEVYNRALMLHKDARVVDALKLLEDFMEEQQQRAERENVTNIEKDLLDLYKELLETDFRGVPENPKLVKLQEILLSVLGDRDDVRGIVFVRSKELVSALVAWMNQTEALKHLKAQRFVGQNASAVSGGMTRSGQVDALQYFRDGHHKVIVATSIAEEGLDITKCNLVLRYEHVTTEIVRLQSKGRARAPDSKYYVLTEVGSWIVDKEETNARLEILMNVTVPLLQQEIALNTNDWERELLEIQRNLLAQEIRDEEKRAAGKSHDQFELQCLNCSSFICMSIDIRIIQNAHHVIIADDIKERVINERSPVPKYEENDLQFDGTIYCSRCHHDLGGVCTYKTIQFPLLAIRNFRVVDGNGKASTHKQWKKVRFIVQPFTLNNLEEIVVRRLLEEQ